MGRLAVYKFAYFLSILFTIFILGLSIFAYFSGKINPVENMFAAYVALSKPILVVVNTILFIYWLIRLRYWLWIPLTGLIVNYEYITSMYQIYNPTKYANEYNPQIQISAESETKRSIFREKDKTKRSKKESAQHSKSRNKSFVMTSVSAL